MHAWGLFAKSPIPKEDFVIEYVGETIRSSLEDVREAVYERSGLDSSYLFRVDKETVVDATKKVRLEARVLAPCASSSTNTQAMMAPDCPETCHSAAGPAMTIFAADHGSTCWKTKGHLLPVQDQSRKGSFVMAVYKTDRYGGHHEKADQDSILRLDMYSFDLLCEGLISVL